MSECPRCGRRLPLWDSTCGCDKPAPRSDHEKNCGLIACPICNPDVFRLAPSTKQCEHGIARFWCDRCGPQMGIPVPEDFEPKSASAVNDAGVPASPREWWIQKGTPDLIADSWPEAESSQTEHREDLPWIHVIEKSAFDAVVKERDHWIKAWGINENDRVEQVARLQAENQSLRCELDYKSDYEALKAKNAELRVEVEKRFSRPVVYTSPDANGELFEWSLNKFPGCTHRATLDNIEEIK